MTRDEDRTWGYIDRISDTAVDIDYGLQGKPLDYTRAPSSWAHTKAPSEVIDPDNRCRHEFTAEARHLRDLRPHRT